MTIKYLHLEIATEVAWQIGDILEDIPRAESRWHVCNITKRIIDAGFITEETEDLDTLVSAYLQENEGY